MLLLHQDITAVYIEPEYRFQFKDLEVKESVKDTRFKFQDYNNDESRPDLVITIGGDGTVLWSNYLFGLKQRPPFLTFNMGTLGYLAYYNCKLLEEIITLIITNPKDFLIMEKRSTLEFGKITKKDIIKEQKIEDQDRVPIKKEGDALNDLIISRDSIRAVILDVYLNDNYMTTLRSDGIIVATSTGSTAYSLSSGGSIVHYDVDCLLMSSICPHSLSFRPIVFPRDAKLKILVNQSSPSKAHYCNDGINEYCMGYDEGVEVTVSDNYLNIIVLEKYVKSPLILWMEKMVDQLGWNTAFKNLG